MQKTQGGWDWMRWGLMWLGQSAVNEGGEGWRAALLDLRKGPEHKEGWEQFRADEREMTRSDEVLDVVDFGAESEKEGRHSSVRVSDLAKRASSDLRKGRWLSAAAAHVTRNKEEGVRRIRILEVGTCLGSGGAQLFHGCGGLLEYVGLEGSPVLAQRTASRLKRLYPQANVSVLSGPFSATLGPFLKEAQPLDLVFLDGHHEGQALLHQWRQIRAALAPGALVIVDDIRWSDDMHRAWVELLRDPSISAMDVFRMGILCQNGEVSIPSHRRVVRAPWHLWA